MNVEMAPGYVAPPLPPLDAKITDVHDALKERALAGDGKAACRLAIDLQQCVWQDAILQGLDRTMQQMTRQPQGPLNDTRRKAMESSMLDMMQAQADYVARLTARCEGLSEAQVADHVDWWRKAASTGHLPSLVHYAKGDAFRMNATLDNLDRLAAYKGEAERLMRTAAAAGSPEALQQLLLAYAPERGPRDNLLQQAVKPDPAEAQAILRLMQERGIPLPRDPASRSGQPAEPPSSLSRLDTTEQARAEQRLVELRTQWPQTDTMAATMRAPWELEDDRRKACDQDRFATLH